jgi:pSer/pThr/pTyr-binding forkhead associated (FHA) protein
VAKLEIWPAGAVAPREVELREETTTIGRGKANVVALPDDPRASLRHAVIDRTPDGGVLLRDQSSTNGTWVNRCRVRQHLLADGDQIQVGDTVMIFLAQGQVGKASASVTAGDDTPSGLV